MLILLCLTVFIDFQGISAQTAVGMDDPVFKKPLLKDNLPKDFLETLIKMKEIDFFKLNFVQRKKLKALKNPLVSEGLFVYLKDLGMVWEISEPISALYKIGPAGQLLTDGDMTPENQRQALLYKEILSPLLLIIQLDLKLLADEFELFFQLEEKEKWSVGLIPRKIPLALWIRSIKIQGEKNNWIKTISILETKENSTIITFSENNPGNEKGFYQKRYFNKAD